MKSKPRTNVAPVNGWNAQPDYTKEISRENTAYQKTAGKGAMIRPKQHTPHWVGK